MSNTEQITLYEPPAAGLVHPASAFAALAHLTDAQLDAQIALLNRAQTVAARVKTALMKTDVHYGVIPGTNKPSLLKPGAEVLLQAFQLAASYSVDFRDGDGRTSPDVRAIVICRVHLGDTTGPVIAEGVGEANSWEKKHRRRQAKPTCPQCGKQAIARGSLQYGGGYYCNRNQGGCGANFKANSTGAKEIESQQTGEIDNPDPHDLANTLVKMAKKRAVIDATLTATASSDLFTQDVEDHAPPQRHRDDAPPPPQDQPRAGRNDQPAGPTGGEQDGPPVSQEVVTESRRLWEMYRKAPTDVRASIGALSLSGLNDPATADRVRSILEPPGEAA